MLISDKSFFTESSHTYERNGVKIPSVTKILWVLSKDSLLPWAIKIILNTFEIWVKVTQTLLDAAKEAPNLIRDAAGTEGKEVHKAIEDYIDGKEVQCESLAYKAFKSFVSDVKPNIIMREQLLYNEVLEYAGTFDAFAEINGKSYILDWKTSSSMQWDYMMQLAWYLLCMPEDIKVDGLGIVHLDKFTGKYEVVLVDDPVFINKIKEGFIACVKLFHLRKELSSLVSIIPASREKRFNAITLKN